MRKKFFALILMVLLSISLFPVKALDVSAKGAILVECSTGDILYEKNCDTILSMASTTKIMTALVAIEQGDLEKLITIPSKAAGIIGSSIYLVAGEKMTLYELLCGLLLHSGNDAAMAIAIAVGGSEEDFVGLMNEKAKVLGLTNTSFANASGLDSDSHYTTARDLGNLARYAMNNSIFAEIVGMQKTTISYKNDGKRYLTNHNKMLRLYDGATGIKTGFTKKSGRCLVSSATREGISLVAVTLSAPDDWNDHQRLLDYGFEITQKKSLIAENEIVYTLTVYNSDRKNVMIMSSTDAELIMRTDTKSELKTVLELPRFLYAPIAQGEQIGWEKFYKDGILVRRIALISQHSCPLLPEKEEGFWGKLLNFFEK